MSSNVGTEQGKPNIDFVTSILDPLLSDNFRMTFSPPKKVLDAMQPLINLNPNGSSITTPGGTAVANNDVNNSLTVQCRSASKPGSQLEVVPVDIAGHSLQYAGRLTFSHSMSMEFVEDRRAIISRSLFAWQQLARTIRTQHGCYKSEYATKGYLYIYDQTGGKPMMQYEIINMWPSDVPDIQFDGSGANLITVSATFTYDSYLDTTLDMDKIVFPALAA